MNVHRGYEGARNEAFLSLHSRRVPHPIDDPPPPLVTNVSLLQLESTHPYMFAMVLCYMSVPT